MTERWKKIPTHPLYLISDHGRVRNTKPRSQSVKNDGLIRLKGHRGGYKFVTLYDDNHGTNFLLHRLVAEAFIPNTDDRPEVNHIDGIKTNNVWTNLEWATSAEQKFHAWRVLRNHKSSRTVMIWRDGVYPIVTTNVREWAQQNDVSQSHIAAVLSGRVKHAKGWKAKYVENNQ